MSEATAARTVCKRCGAVTNWIGNPKVLNGRLPAYEAAVDALERLCHYTDAAADCPYPAHDACDHRKWLREETDLARAALRCLRPEVPA